jgi:hypothetical protein
MALPVMLQGVGNVEAFSTVEIRPQVSGPLLTVTSPKVRRSAKGSCSSRSILARSISAVKSAEAALAKDTGQSKTAEVQSRTLHAADERTA